MAGFDRSTCDGGGAMSRYTQLRWQSVVKGVATRVPAVSRFTNTAAGSPVGARYYYSVWLRHLVSIAQTRPHFSRDVVAELGPGDALGLGLCALLSGTRRYIGLDRLAFGLRADNLALLDELAELFRARSSIPDHTEMPSVFPRLANYAFPHSLVPENVLCESLSASRLARLRNALEGVDNLGEDSPLCYAAPWDAGQQIRPASVDLLVSQAVMEHVDDIDAAYAAMHRWLKPDAIMSHRIDYTCHGITHDWYGHWTVPTGVWRIVRGKRAYLINRLPHSAHMAALRRNHFEILACVPTASDTPAPASAVCIPHQGADLSIKGAFVVARPAAT
jgi:SAM-dependent methyltransferase